MADIKDQPSLEFDNFLAPLLLMSSIVYEKTGLARVLDLKKNYKDAVQKNPEAIDILKNIIKACIKEIIQTLSISYRNKLKQIYSDDGVVNLIDYLVKKEMQKSLE